MHIGKKSSKHRKRGKGSKPFDNDLLTEEEAAYVLDLKRGSLAVFRSTGRHGIPFIKIGRNVRYRRSDLEDWLISRTHSTGMTAEQTGCKSINAATGDSGAKS